METYKAVSYHIISYHIISHHITSHHITSHHISYIWYHISYHIISYHIISCITSYHIFMKTSTIDSGNGFSRIWQGFTWTNADYLSFGPWGGSFNQISIKIWNTNNNVFTNIIRYDFFMPPFCLLDQKLYKPTMPIVLREGYQFT